MYAVAICAQDSALAYLLKNGGQAITLTLDHIRNVDKPTRTCPVFVLRVQVVKV
jgi:hypothetical protein